MAATSTHEAYTSHVCSNRIGPRIGRSREAECVDGLELVLRRRVGQPEVVAEVGREAGGPGEDREREARDDLVRAQRDHEEREEQRHRRTRERRDDDREEEHHPTLSPDPLHAPEPHHRADEHHPLDAEVEDAGALREQLAEGRVEQRRAVGDAGGDDEDEDRVVHRAASAAVAGSAGTSGA